LNGNPVPLEARKGCGTRVQDGNIRCVIDLKLEAASMSR
jgi:hypothetical protein